MDLQEKNAICAIVIRRSVTYTVKSFANDAGKDHAESGKTRSDLEPTKSDLGKTRSDLVFSNRRLVFPPHREWVPSPPGRSAVARGGGRDTTGRARRALFSGPPCKKTGKTAGVLKENVIFAKPARRKPFTGREVWVYIYGRRLLDALFLTIRNFATSHLAQDKATVDALWVCLGQPVLYPCVKGTDRRRLTNISAWASALLVSARWAMRRPRIAGRAMVQTPALFHARTRTLNSLSGELKGKSKPSDR